jgi:hypothetical protein
VCTALVLGTHDWSSGSDGGDFTRLTGRTSDGFRIQMGVLDGKLQSFDTHVKVRCPGGETRQWRWYPADHVPVPFHQDRGRVRVFEQGTTTAPGGPSLTRASELRARIADDGRTVRGLIRPWAVWGRGTDSIACFGKARFSARAID